MTSRLIPDEGGGKPSPRAAVLWLTGLPGAGKSTIAQAVCRQLCAAGRAAVVVDGDDLRHGLSSDLGFSDRDRAENVRRAAEVARLMVDAGITVIVALISPFRADRDRARARFEPGRFVEVFVDTPLAVAEARDPKGLYRLARSGALTGLTGVDGPYEPPVDPEFIVRTVDEPAEQAAARLLARLA